MKTAFLITAFSLFVFANGCDDSSKTDAEIVDNILSTQLTGSADDGDTTTPSDSYGPAGNDMDAEDSKTKASSTAPAYNIVTGKVTAETLNPGGQTIIEDEARASSFNKVVSPLKVNKAGSFTFDIDLDVRDITLVGEGKVTITVQASVLNNNGVAVQNGGIANVTFEARNNQAGTAEIIIANDSANPDSLQNNDYTKTLSGPNGGVQLGKGDFRLELDLRIIATAPTAQGPNTNAHSAKTGEVKAEIKLR